MLFNNHRSKLQPRPGSLRLYAQPAAESTEPGAEQHCSRGPTGTDQRWRLSSYCRPSRMSPGPEGRTTLQQGLATVDGGRRVDVPIWMSRSAGRTRETMERLSRERPSQREIPVADHYRTGPSRAVCVSILTIMDITVNPGPSNIPLHCRIWRTLYSFG